MNTPLLILVGSIMAVAGFAAAQTRPAGTASAPATSQAATTTAATKPQVTFCGLAVETSRVVFVVDHSGSMLDTLDDLKRMVKKSIVKIAPPQQFGIVAVSSDKASIIAQSKLKLFEATPKNIESAQKAIDELRGPSSGDDLLPPLQEAFEYAFRLRPDTIIFITDGHFDPKLEMIVARLNKNQIVVIHTFALLNKEPSYEEQLKKMANDNRGKYKFVSEKDLEQNNRK